MAMCWRNEILPKRPRYGRDVGSGERMRKHKYLVSYCGKMLDGNLLYGEITLSAKKKLKSTDIDDTRVIIANTSTIDIDVRTIIIMSIFYFGKEVVKWLAIYLTSP